MKIETKYSPGDIVYSAGFSGGQRQTPCPDCLGQKEWQCRTPAGEEFAVPCGTCYSAWNSTGYISSYGTDPRVERLTIGTVQVDTRGNEIRYMCKETGIGSGTLHSEDRLFRTEAEAMVRAVEMAQEAERERIRRNAETSRRAKGEPRRKPRKA